MAVVIKFFIKQMKNKPENLILSHSTNFMNSNVQHPVNLTNINILIQFY